MESYCLTYFKEEIQAEQLVRKLEPFRRFLEVAAQMNGKIINYSKIGLAVGVESTTIQNYFSILEDTLLGITLPAFHESVRKRQRLAPKFYFFDTGVARALSGEIVSKLVESTYNYGNAFEQFVILEILKLASYKKKRWTFSYLRTKENVEIDLIIDRPQQSRFCIELKSSKLINRADISSFIKISQSIKNSQSLCLSNDPSLKDLTRLIAFTGKTEST